MSFVRPLVAGSVLSVLVLAAGCAGMSDRGVMFRDTQRRYTQLMRFTEFDKAGHFVVPEERDSFRATTKALGDLRFSDYQVQDVETAGDTGTARVSYTGYRVSSPIVVTFVEEQQWERTGDSWQVRSTIEEHTQ
jgi:hypothetical protein